MSCLFWRYETEIEILHYRRIPYNSRIQKKLQKLEKRLGEPEISCKRVKHFMCMFISKVEINYVVLVSLLLILNIFQAFL